MIIIIRTNCKIVVILSEKKFINITYILTTENERQQSLSTSGSHNPGLDFHQFNHVNGGHTAQFVKTIYNYEKL